MELNSDLRVMNWKIILVGPQEGVVLVTYTFQYCILEPTLSDLFLRMAYNIPQNSHTPANGMYALAKMASPL